MCRYMFATESVYDILPPASGYMNRCVYSGDDAMASTTSRTFIRPLLSWRTQLELAASGCRSSMWRYSSFTTCCASVVQGCCAATDQGKNKAQVSIAAARYIHIPLSSPSTLCFRSCATPAAQFRRDVDVGPAESDDRVLALEEPAP